MAYLRYGLEKREGFIVITGGIGTGKTMLVRHLLSELESSDVIAAQLVTTQVDPEDMLRIVCSSLVLARRVPRNQLCWTSWKSFSEPGMQKVNVCCWW